MPSSPNADQPDADRPPSAGRRSMTVRVGFGLFAVGLVFLIVTVIPFFFDDHNRSLWLNLGCMLAPLGFVVVVIGVIRTGRAEQRAAFAAVSASEPADGRR